MKNLRQSRSSQFVRSTDADSPQLISSYTAQCDILGLTEQEIREALSFLSAFPIDIVVQYRFPWATLRSGTKSPTHQIPCRVKSKRGAENPPIAAPLSIQYSLESLMGRIPCRVHELAPDGLALKRLRNLVRCLGKSSVLDFWN